MALTVGDGDGSSSLPLLAALMLPPPSNYSGASKLNRDIHSIPHCTFEHGCNSLPFADDAAWMVSDDGAEQWNESLLLIALTPLLAFVVILLIDIIIRWARYACRRKAGDADEGCRACCHHVCCSCCCLPPEDRQPGDDLSSVPPSSRVAFLGSGRIGNDASDAFPQAEVLSHLSSSSPYAAATHQVNKRGGMAGQYADAYQYNRPSNPSSRLVGASHTQTSYASDDWRIHQFHDHHSRRHHPDGRFRYRTICAWMWALLALGCLAAAVWASFTLSDHIRSVRHDVQAGDYFDHLAGNDVEGVLSVEYYVQSSSSVLHIMDVAANRSGSPLPTDRRQQIYQLIGQLKSVAQNNLEPLVESAKRQSRHVDDWQEWMRDADEVRRIVTYSLIGVQVVFTTLLLIIHSCARRKYLLSVCCSSFVGLLIIGIGAIFAFGLWSSILASDVCMDPVEYSRAALNYAAHTTHHHKHSISADDAVVLGFYLDCEPALTQPQSRAGAASSPMASPSYLMNPLYESYFKAAWQNFTSSSYQSEANSLCDYILDARPSLHGLVDSYRRYNGSIVNQSTIIIDQLACQPVHNRWMEAMEQTCHPTVNIIWIQTSTLFFACVLLFFVRCCVHMRVRGAHDHELIVEEEYQHSTEAPPSSSSMMHMGYQQDEYEYPPAYDESAMATGTGMGMGMGIGSGLDTHLHSHPYAHSRSHSPLPHHHLPAHAHAQARVESSTNFEFQEPY